MQFLGNFVTWLGNFLENMGGKILGYNKGYMVRVECKAKCRFLMLCSNRVGHNHIATM